MKIDWHEKLMNFKKPLRVFGFTQSIIGLTGIIMATISLKGSVKILKLLVKGKSCIGNEPYLMTILVTLGIGMILLLWGFKNVFSSFGNMMRSRHPSPLEFENYSEIEILLVKKHISPYERLLETVIKKDIAFVKKSVFFLGFIIIGLLVRMVIPSEFFWKLRITPAYFSFPLLFVAILASTTGLRLLAVYYYQQLDNREAEVGEMIKSIKGEGNPYDFIPQIEKALLKLEGNEKSHFVFRSGFSEAEDSQKNTGKIHKKLLYETYPQYIPYLHHPLLHLLILAAIILNGSGFYFLLKLPPDNISVLTVPTIAIDYAWTIVKGIILEFSGIGLLNNIYRIVSSSYFRSVMVFVELEGIFEKKEILREAVRDEAVKTSQPPGTVFRNDCHFKVYITTFLTEMKAVTGKRYIVNMSLGTKADQVKNIITDVIETFG